MAGASLLAQGRESSMQCVMVTGGCGFIGSNFVRYLLETDPTIRVVNFDCLSYAGNLANLAGQTPTAETVFGML